MSALDTAKEIARMTSAASLGKDVIDLLKEKVSLLTEQIATLETENANLKKKVADLEQEIDRLRPKDDLEKEAIKILQLLANRSGLRIGQIANFLGISEVRAEYHRDNLMAAEMIGYHGGIVEMGDEPSALRSRGREYLVKHGHI